MEEKRKTRIGRVVSKRMNKTVMVAVETLKRYPTYKKTVTRAVKHLAHDEENKCQIGDMVKMVETRPLSRHKRWRVVEIIAKGEVAEVQPKEIT